MHITRQPTPPPSSPRLVNIVRMQLIASFIIKPMKLEDIWWWLKEVYIANLYYQTDDVSTDGLFGEEHVSDGYGYKLGPPTIRQLRAEWG